LMLRAKVSHRSGGFLCMVPINSRGLMFVLQKRCVLIV
jgi:hypothetical protein